MMVARIDRRRIGRQNESYRRGVVLGLTMAEIGILVIFVLLLLLVYRDRLRQRAVERELTARAQLVELASELGLEPGTSGDDFRRLVRIIREAAALPTTAPALREGLEALGDIRRARDEMRAAAATAARDGVDGLLARVEQQSFRQANQEGQLLNLERRLAAVGQGRGARPCWVQPDGTIDYLYDVALTSSGIRLRERVYTWRARERQLIPIPMADPGEVLSEAEFASRTAALFAHSQRNNCRFFVVVFDGTAVTEKETYKSQLRTVEGHFYKLLANGPPPF